jgi:hypothetical protein
LFNPYAIGVGAGVHATDIPGFIPFDTQVSEKGRRRTGRAALTPLALRLNEMDHLSRMETLEMWVTKRREPVADVRRIVDP